MKSQLITRSTADLLTDLAFQYPLQAATFAACPVCADPMGSRGGWYCRECITGELLGRGVNQHRLDDLKDRLVMMQQLQEQVEAMMRELAR